jgi:hypothetical protein
MPVQQVDEHRRRLVREDPAQQQALFAIGHRPAAADATQERIVDQHHRDLAGTCIKRRRDAQYRLLGTLLGRGTGIERIDGEQADEAERDQHTRPPRRRCRRVRHLRRRRGGAVHCGRIFQTSPGRTGMIDVVLVPGPSRLAPRLTPHCRGPQARGVPATPARRGGRRVTPITGRTGPCGAVAGLCDSFVT